MSTSLSTAKLLAVLGFLCLVILPFDRAQALAITLHGRVTNHVTGLPIEGARISAYVNFDVEVGKTESAADGSYAITGEVTPTTGGTGILYVSANGYIHTSRNFSPLESDILADFAMRKYGSISGMVRHRVTGAALDIAPVSVLKFDGESWRGSPNAWTGNGNYSITVAPGDYLVCAGGIGSNFARQCFDGVDVHSVNDLTASTLIAVADGARISGIDLRISEGARLSGTIRDERTGQPLAFKQLSIELYDNNGIPIDAVDETRLVTSDENGRYELDGVPDGTFYLTADIHRGAMRGKQLYPGIPCPSGVCPPATSGQAISVSDGASVDGIDFTFGPVATLQGAITDRSTGTPLGGVQVIACTEGELILWPDCYPGTSSAVDGRYQVDLAPGYYLIYTEAPDSHADLVYPDIPCVSPLCQRTYGPRYSVREGDALSGYDFALSPSSTIAGVVVDDVTGEPTWASLAVFDSNYKFLWSFSARENGEYVSPRAPGGTYYIAAFQRWRERCTFYLDLPCPVSPSDPIAIAAIHPTPVVVADGRTASGVDFRLPLEPPVFADGFESQTQR